MKDADRKTVLDDFKSNKYQYLVAVDALNAGLDVPNVDGAICVSGVSTELVATQQLGRTARYVQDKFALFINFYSTDTVEERWVKTKNANLKNVWVHSTNQIKEWLKYHEKDS